MMADLLITHPGKHHVLHLVAGCIMAGASGQYVTPFYCRGLGRLVSLMPGDVGMKAKGYFHAGLPRESVVAPVDWQLRKLWSFYRGTSSYESAFDSWVAKEIGGGKLRAKIIVTLQDYMPKTVRAAKARGFSIWSDQISNQSAETSARITRHEEAHGLSASWRHDETENAEIVGLADFVTVPSAYTLEGVQGHIAPLANISIVPYGADPERFQVDRIEDSEEIVVLARAQSVRKGGHLLCRALSECGPTLLRLCSPRRIKVVILGDLEPTLNLILDQVVLPPGLTVEHGSVPHRMIPQLYQRASLFVMPSLSESMSLACIEALHAGLPLIITRYCGIDDFIHGRMGYEIADTTESLAAAMVSAFEHRQQWRQWGMEAKRLADQLTWSAYEERISQLANDIL